MRTKRFLSILLSLMLVLGMLPGMSLAASAADTTTTITSPATTGTMTITLAIAAASVKTAPEANTLTYSGSAQTLTTTGEAGVGTLQYQLGESATTEPTGTWGTTVPQGTEAKDYYVWYRSRVNDNNISTAGCKTVTIAKASITNATVTLSDTSLVYTGLEQSVTVSSVKLGDTTLTANTDYEVTSGTIGTAKNTYTVTVTGKGNYKDTATAQWSIGLATPTIETIPTASAITYGQKLADSTLTGGVAKLGDTTVAGTFAWKNTETKLAVSDSNATEYDVVFTPTDADNYAAVECKVKLTVNKADPTVTAPTAKTLTYNGSAQSLINAGTASGGTIYYAVTTENTAPTDESLYTTSIPTATNAGTYYVWYKVKGDDSYNDSEPDVIPVSIKEEAKHQHTIVRVDEVEPGCETNGYKAHYECKECGMLFEDNPGQVQISEKDIIIKATGHKWDKGEVTKEATYDEEGIRTYTCSVCGETKTESIKKKERPSSYDDSDDSSSDDSDSGSSSSSGSSSKRYTEAQAKVDQINNVSTYSIPENHQVETGVPASDVGGRWGNNANADTWTYTKSDGSLAKSEWLSLDYNGLRYWYYFNDDGNMHTNWFDYKGERFYLMPDKDGWRGRMATGWKNIENKWYYFDIVPGSSQGRLYRSTVTPDGHTVGADGAWNGVGATPVGQK